MLLLQHDQHWEKWWLRPVTHRTLLVFSEALICLSYTAMVPPLGIAPGSSAYQADALPFSYGGWKKMVARPSAALGVSSSQARRIAVFLAREKKLLEMWLRGPDSNRRFAAYETAALPLGYPAM